MFCQRLSKIVQIGPYSSKTPPAFPRQYAGRIQDFLAPKQTKHLTNHGGTIMTHETTGIPPLARRIPRYFTLSNTHESTREHILLQEERRRERTRIAQELHDTWLQGLLSASMQLQVAEGWLPADSPAKRLLARVRNLMRKGIDDGRAALQGLRCDDAPATSLEQALADFQDELPPPDRARLRIATM